MQRKNSKVLLPSVLHLTSYTLHTAIKFGIYVAGYFSTYLQNTYVQITYMKTNLTKKKKEEEENIPNCQFTSSGNKATKRQLCGQSFASKSARNFFKQNLIFCRTQENLLKKPKSLVITHSQRCFYGFLLFFKNQNGSCPLSSLNNLFLDSFFYQEYLTTYIPLSRFSINLFLYLFKSKQVN